MLCCVCDSWFADEIGDLVYLQWLYMVLTLWPIQSSLTGRMGSGSPSALRSVITSWKRKKNEVREKNAKFPTAKFMEEGSEWFVWWVGWLEERRKGEQKWSSKHLDNPQRPQCKMQIGPPTSREPFHFCKDVHHQWWAWYLDSLRLVNPLVNTFLTCRQGRGFIGIQL